MEQGAAAELVPGGTREQAGRLDSKNLKRTLFVMGIPALGIYLGQFLWSVGTRFGFAIVVFLLAWLLSFVLLPLVRLLRQLGLPRLLATGTAYLAMIGMMALFGVFLAPAMIADLTELTRSVAGYRSDVLPLVADFEAWLTRMGLPEGSLEEALLGSTSNFTDFAGTAAAEVLAAVTGVASAIVGILLTLVVSFYLVLNWDQAVIKLERSLPDRWGIRLHEALGAVEHAFAAYLRGVLTEVVIFGVATGIAMSIGGVEYVVLISIVAGLLLVVPWVGAIIGIMLPMLAASLDSWTTALWIGLALTLVELTIDNVIKPMVVGISAKVNPLVIIVSILIGTIAVGLWGAVFAVPFGALGYIAARTGYFRWVARRPDDPGFDPAVADGAGSRRDGLDAFPGS